MGWGGGEESAGGCGGAEGGVCVGSNSAIQHCALAYGALNKSQEQKNKSTTNHHAPPTSTYPTPSRPGGPGSPPAGRRAQWRWQRSYSAPSNSLHGSSSRTGTPSRTAPHCLRRRGGAAGSSVATYGAATPLPLHLPLHTPLPPTLQNNTHWAPLPPGWCCWAGWRRPPCSRPREGPPRPRWVWSGPPRCRTRPPGCCAPRCTTRPCTAG